MNEDKYCDPIFGSCEAGKPLEKYAFPKSEHSANTIYELIKNELDLDGNARQNLATFCQTWDSKEVHLLMDLSLNKNMIDKDEYPQSAELERRCVRMISNLWHAEADENPIGNSTVGSSEACFLAGLALYFRWKEARLKMGKDITKPNLVCGPVQIVWEKFCQYWDIEIRQIPMTEDRFYMDAPSMLSQIDENTIGVVTTFGLTFTGKYEPVKELSDALDTLEKEKGLDIRLHVDAASGGFLAPFCAPDLIWDFRLPRVNSISASGHKFGMSPLGCGWVVWRGEEYLPEKLIFHVNYLGGDMPVFQINFSRPAGQVISQYYLFNRLGMEGYRKIHSLCYNTAMYLANEIKKIDAFELVYTPDPKDGIPAITWRVRKDADLSYSLYDLAEVLRMRGWQVPAYSLPANAENIVVQRILVRQGFTKDMAELLIGDMKRAVDALHKNGCFKTTEKSSGGFNHNS